jgi:nicotinate-nucleotide adenylyltransferase
VSGVFVRLPSFGARQTIGLLGGSFNPAHEGHRLISEIALHRLGLNRVWWLVTPGNPLKSLTDLQALDARQEAARKIARDPRIDVADFEAAIGSRYTFQTLRFLHRRAPNVRFVWIMGADNLTQFHRWQHWREIAATTPILVIDRPGSTLRALSSPAALALQRWRRPERDARHFAAASPPAILFLHGPRSTLSSTALRRAHSNPRSVLKS